jgi:hypothetical protein
LTLGVTDSAVAGTLLSATFTMTTQIFPTFVTPPFSVTSTAVTGELLGDSFRLDAGSGLAAQASFPITPPSLVPITAVVAQIGNNGSLTGTLAQISVMPTGPIGITGSLRLRGRIGKGPPFTALVVPINAGAGVTEINPNPTLEVLASVIGDSWGFETKTVTVTNAGAPNGTVMISGGGVSVTPGGNTHVQLVSLGRIRVRGSAVGAGWTVALGNRLTLVYPEPSSLLLLSLAGAGVCAGRWRLRRAR